MNELLDSFLNISTNFKKFVEINDLWRFHPDLLKFHKEAVIYAYNNNIREGESLAKALIKIIARQSAENDYLFIQNVSYKSWRRYSVTYNNKFFFGNNEQVTEKLLDYLNEECHHEAGNSVFIYNFIEDKKADYHYHRLNTKKPKYFCKID